ncbi:plasmid segregation protein ParM, partial [Salmonella enterica subsp. enterica serovar Lubbock]|nr:plasmid segregation protein ParM [Salmonella enterica subsp. enterica serovar Lubbock]
GNSGIGVSSVTKAAMSALRMASSDTSFLVADELIKRRNDPDFDKLPLAWRTSAGYYNVV